MAKNPIKSNDESGYKIVKPSIISKSRTKPNEVMTITLLQLLEKSKKSDLRDLIGYVSNYSSQTEEVSKDLRLWLTEVTFFLQQYEKLVNEKVIKAAAIDQVATPAILVEISKQLVDPNQRTNFNYKLEEAILANHDLAHSPWLIGAFNGGECPIGTAVALQELLPTAGETGKVGYFLFRWKLTRKRMVYSSLINGIYFGGLAAYLRYLMRDNPQFWQIWSPRFEFSWFNFWSSFVFVVISLLVLIVPIMVTYFGTVFYYIWVEEKLIGSEREKTAGARLNKKIKGMAHKIGKISAAIFGSMARIKKNSKGVK